MNSEERCETCRFWAPTEDELGTCRRHAPQPFLDGMVEQIIKNIIGNPDFSLSLDIALICDFVATWPLTRDENWCGEWKERHQ